MWSGLFFFTLLVSSVLVGWAWLLNWRLTTARRRDRLNRTLAIWAGKGLLLPLLIWVVMNLGLSWSLQPFMPQIQNAQINGLPWFYLYMRVISAGLFIVASYWSAITIGWALFKAHAELDEDMAADFKRLCWTWFAGLALPVAALVFLGGWGTFGLGLTAMFGGMGHYAGALIHTKKTPPMYSRAIAKLKFGKYAEAEWEIIHELEKCEDDFEGWMMLAELYATHFQDLGEAQNTIAEICEHPKVSHSQFSIALHRLADWHLKLGDDPEGARRALQVICDRMPGSHLARMAQLRINQLPRNVDELQEQRTASAIPLPALGDSLDEETAPDSNLDRKKAIQSANSCVERLEENPNDVPTREKLARLLAERLDQPQRGIEQIWLLLDMPGQPVAKQSEWLSFVAAWHLKYLHDTEAGRKTLEKLVREFPNSLQAMTARRRLRLLHQEARINNQ